MIWIAGSSNRFPVVGAMEFDCGQRGDGVASPMGLVGLGSHKAGIRNESLVIMFYSLGEVPIDIRKVIGEHAYHGLGFLKIVGVENHPVVIEGKVRKSLQRCLKLRISGPLPIMVKTVLRKIDCRDVVDQ